MRRRILKAFAILAILAVLGFAALLAALWLERRSEIALPALTGTFAVGREIYDWAGDGHEVLAWIWYPATPSAATGDYVPAALRAAAERNRGGPLHFLTHDWSKVHCHSLRNAEVSPRQRSYPVVILRGGASAEVVSYSTLAEDLASHGYVVVGFDAPYRTGLVVFPDGRVIGRAPQYNPELCSDDACYNRLLALWVADIGFVLDRLATLNGKFAGRLDMTRVGVFGHSFGGSQAAQFCAQDPRCKAGIDIDGILLGNVVQTGIHKPFMFLLSDHSNESDPQRGRILADIQSVYDRLPPNARCYVVIPGANHFAFSDDGAVLKSRLVRSLMRIDGRRQLAVTAENIHSFFDAYLK